MVSTNLLLVVNFVLFSLFVMVFLILPFSWATSFWFLEKKKVLLFYHVLKPRELLILSCTEVHLLMWGLFQIVIFAVDNSPMCTRGNIATCQ